MTAALTASVTASGAALKWLGRVDYLQTAAAMQAFSESRTTDTPDEIWLCEHPAVYTQGVAGRDEHLLTPGDVPVVRANRGGQVTYHGPGQVVAYPLVDLARLGIFVKEYVYRVEHAVLKTLESYGVTGHRVVGAPGIYVELADPFGHSSIGAYGPAATGADDAHRFDGLGKIAALGIKVTRHRTYHGVALNVAMDLSPFAGIDPCGYAGLRTIDLATLGSAVTWNDAARRLGDSLSLHLSR